MGWGDALTLIQRLCFSHSSKERQRQGSTQGRRPQSCRCPKEPHQDSSPQGEEGRKGERGEGEGAELKGGVYFSFFLQKKGTGIAVLSEKSLFLGQKVGGKKNSETPLKGHP